ncbi:MAG: amino acid adenylation domain-containing protein [Bacteroidales bacterium]|jgi:amino acid adenylation domain-containing protein|nr:amino acid adenylation domain-containing protein [Bacteroidales bacterium]
MMQNISKEQLARILALRKQKGLQNTEKNVRMERNADSMYPLSSAEKRFWFLENFSQNKALYNNPVYAFLDMSDTEFQIDDFNKAINKVIERHEIFRTSFLSKNGIPYQHISDNISFNIGYEDISQMPLTEKEAYIKNVAKNEMLQKISLHKAPLLRMKILRTEKTRYFFLYTPHHIISDGWSNALFIKEFITVYKGEQLPPVGMQFVDCVQYENDYLQSEKCKNDTAYWKNILNPLPENLRLPFDKVLKGKNSDEGKMFLIPLGIALTDKIHKFCRERKMSSFPFFFSILNILLYKYTEQESIVTGVPSANRNIPAMQNVSGLLFNTLPFLTKIDGNMSFNALLQKTDINTEENLKHQMLPFERIVSELGIERNTDTTPLFQVLFSFQNIPSLYSVGEVKVSPYKLDAGLTKYALNFWVEKYNGEFVITLKANTTRFSEEKAERILQHYKNTVEYVLENPNVLINNIEFLTDSEKYCIAQINEKSKFTAFSIIDKLKETVKENPLLAAVTSGNKTLSYSQIEELSDKLSHNIITKNINRKPVVILLPRSVDMLVVMLAVMKSGVPYVPVDTDFPKERINEIISDCGAEVVIDKEFVENSSCADSGNEHRIAKTNIAGVFNADSIAYIIYTSGTTGKPKGVEISYGALSNYIQAISERIAFDKNKTFALVSTLAADLGYTMLFPSIFTSGTLLIATKDEIYSPELLAKRFTEFKPCYLKITPSHLSSLLVAGKNILPLTAIICGGEVFPTSLVKKIKELNSSIEIYNHYGPTETTVGVLTYKIAGDEETIPLGKPLNGNEIYVLDKNKQWCAAGIEGDMYIGGRQLARGYFNRDELTAEKFVTLPQTGKTVYYTGDRALWQTDGNFFFTGRSDKQIKIRGNRIETDEIEKCIEKISGAEKVIVLVKDGELVALVKIFSGIGADTGADNSVETERIKEHAAEILPSYMIPQKIIFCNKFPVTENGKIDEQKILEMFSSKYDKSGKISEKQYILNEKEKQIISLFEQVLNIRNVSPEESFFFLGGNSLKAMELLYYLNKTFNTKLPVHFLFNNSSVKQIAAALYKESNFQTVILLKKGLSKKIMFLVHPAGGSLFSYSDFIKQLPEELTVYGLQAKPDKIEATDIGQMADSYVSEIKDILVESEEVIFAGWSMGALIAYEMACVTKQGLTVIVLDQPAYQKDAVKADDLDLMVSFAHKAERFANVPFGITKEILLPLSCKQRSELFFKKFTEHDMVPETLTLENFNGFLELMVHHNRISSKYMPSGIYNGTVILVKAQEPLSLDENTPQKPCDLLWKEYVKTLKIIEVNGNHVSMMRLPNVEKWSKQMFN